MVGGLERRKGAALWQEVSGPHRAGLGLSVRIHCSPAKAGVTRVCFPLDLGHPLRCILHRMHLRVSKMADARKVEIFSAGCAICNETIEAVKREASSSSEVIVHDMRDMRVVQRARELGIRSIPAVVIDGKLANCCLGRGVKIGVLKSAGL